MENLFMSDVLMERKNYLNKKKEFLLKEYEYTPNQSKKDKCLELLELIEEGLIFVDEEISFYTETDCLLNDRIWYHRTSAENYNSILKQGFRLPEESTRFGKGIYFMNHLNHNCFGNKIIKCIITGKIISLWHEEIRDIFKEINLEPEEEGIELLE